MNTNNKKRNKTNRGRRPRRATQNPNRLVVPKSLNSFMPDSLINTMKYSDSFIAKTNAGSQYVYWRLKMNDIFDPDPLILSGSLSGFDECAALFRQYLVLSVSVTLDIVNSEAFPVFVAIAPSDIDLAPAITSGATAINLAEYPHAQRKMLGAAGSMNRAKFKLNIDLPEFTGLRQAYMGSNTYSALVNASPAVVTYVNFALAATANFTAAGVVQSTEIKYRVLWSRRQTPEQ